MSICCYFCCTATSRQAVGCFRKGRRKLVGVWWNEPLVSHRAEPCLQARGWQHGQLAGVELERETAWPSSRRNTRWATGSLLRSRNYKFSFQNSFTRISIISGSKRNATRVPPTYLIWSCYKFLFFFGWGDNRNFAERLISIFVLLKQNMLSAQKASPTLDYLSCCAKTGSGEGRWALTGGKKGGFLPPVIRIGCNQSQIP